MYTLKNAKTHEEAIEVIKKQFLETSTSPNPEEEFPLIEQVLQRQHDEMVKESPDDVKSLAMFDYRLMTHHTEDGEPLLVYYSFMLVYVDPNINIDESQKFGYNLMQFGFLRDRRKVANQLTKPFYNKIEDDIAQDVKKYALMSPSMTRMNWLSYVNDIYHHHHFQRYGEFLVRTLSQAM